MSRLGLILVLFSMVLFYQGCLVVDNTFTGLAPGYWRAVLKLDPKMISPNPKGEPLPEKVNLEFEEVAEGELPFTFEVIYDNESDFHIELINGEERIILNDITIGRDLATAKDTIVIQFPVYGSYLRGIFEGNVLEGEWVVPNRGEYRIPFVAKHGMNHRFTNLKKEPVMDLSGKWETLFELDTDEPYPAVGEFVQSGNLLKGTFLTETGDYRFLEGTVQTDKLYLSVFDGAHAFLFEAKIRPDSTLIGFFRSGKHYRTIWEAKLNPKAELTDPLDLTYLVEGYDRLSFSFENPDGKLVSLDDPEYSGKVKIVQLLGTWCPNCRDETNFLRDYLKYNPNDDLAVIGLAFEKYRDPAKAKSTIRNYQEKMKINYEILHAGYFEKAEAAKALPMINHILSYPTMIFIDKDNKVRRIHTGFTGPATSSFDEFKEDFESFLNQLLTD